MADHPPWAFWFSVSLRTQAPSWTLPTILLDRCRNGSEKISKSCCFYVSSPSSIWTGASKLKLAIRDHSRSRSTERKRLWLIEKRRFSSSSKVQLSGNAQRQKCSIEKTRCRSALGVVPSCSICLFKSFWNSPETTLFSCNYPAFELWTCLHLSVLKFLFVLEPINFKIKVWSL